MLLTHAALPYILHGIFPQKPRRLSSILALQRAMKALLTQESSADQENRGELNRLKEQVLEALCEFESVTPLACRALCFHALTHVPDFIYRWGAVRNFWAFFSERLYSCMLFVYKMYSNICMYTIMFTICVIYHLIYNTFTDVSVG